ncbi:MAG: flagellar basal body protein, partial [Escherichia coli]|nr:flagellar basal body protein [Escherichia coli]
MSGLNAAQAALNTASNNISSYNVDAIANPAASAQRAIGLRHN